MTRGVEGDRRSPKLEPLPVLRRPHRSARKPLREDAQARRRAVIARASRQRVVSGGVSDKRERNRLPRVDVESSGFTEESCIRRGDKLGHWFKTLEMASKGTAQSGYNQRMGAT